MDLIGYFLTSDDGLLHQNSAIIFCLNIIYSVKRSKTLAFTRDGQAGCVAIATLQL